MDSQRLDEALALAVDIAREASAELLGVDGRASDIGTKSNQRDLVTEWDTRIEDLIRDRLRRADPGIAIVGEERGTSAGGESELQWLVDPIDGTVNFAHGLPLYGITLALEHRGQPVAGVVCAPELGWMGAARKGGGARDQSGRAMRVSQTPVLDRAMLATGFPYDRAENRRNFAEWEHFQCQAGACRRLGAASLDLWMVARGWLDGYWEAGLSPWDMSAGALLVQEAGGQVTDLRGGPFVSATGTAVATNGAIHAQVLSELAAVGTLIASMES